MLATTYRLAACWAVLQVDRACKPIQNYDQSAGFRPSRHRPGQCFEHHLGCIRGSKNNTSRPKFMSCLRGCGHMKNHQPSPLQHALQSVTTFGVPERGGTTGSKLPWLDFGHVLRHALACENATPGLFATHQSSAARKIVPIEDVAK
jgi:hypothetical protein